MRNKLSRPFSCLFMLISVSISALIFPCDSRSGTLEFDGVPVDITTVTGEDLVIVPGSGGNTQIGDASGTNSSATSNDDLHITGALEVDGASYMDGAATVTGGLTATGGITTGAAIASTGAALALNPASGYGLTSAVTLSGATGNEVAYSLAPTINKATSGNYTGLKLNATETSAPGTADKLMDLQVGGTSWFQVYNGADSANYGLLSLGSGYWDGTTSGYFAGSSHGSQLAVNAPSGFAGNLIDLQVAGSSKFSVDKDGNVTWAGTGGAPVNATYITQTANSVLTAEQALSTLDTGIMKVTTSTGVISSLTGTANYIPKWSDTGTISGTSGIYDDGTNVGIGTTSPASGNKLHVEGQCVTGDTLLPIVRLESWKARKLEKGGSINGIRLRKIEGLSGGDGFSGEDIQDNQGISEGRAIWSYKSVAPGSAFSVAEHSGGEGSLSYEGIHSVSISSQRVGVRSDNTAKDEPPFGISDKREGSGVIGGSQQYLYKIKQSNQVDEINNHLPIQPFSHNAINDSFQLFSHVEYVPIVNVREGDYVLSLNEQTGAIEPHRVNGLLNMGTKPVFKLTTASGRYIKTTGNHPYLVKLEGWKAGKLESWKAGSSSPATSTFSNRSSPLANDVFHARTEWRKVSELKVGDEIATTKADLFRPNADILRFNNKKSSLEFLDSNMPEESHRPMQNFFPGHSFDINYNYPAGFSDIEADYISEILIKGKQGQGMIKAMSEDFSVARSIQPRVINGFDLEAKASQDFNNAGINALVGKNSYHTLMDEDLYRLFAQSHGKFYSYDDIFFGDSRVFFGDISDRVAGSEQIQDIGYGDTGASDAGLTEPDLGVKSNPICEISGSHVYNLLLNKIYHKLLTLSRRLIETPAYAASIVPPASDVLWDRIVFIEYVGYERVYDIEVDGTHNFVAGHFIEEKTDSAFSDSSSSIAALVSSDSSGPLATGGFFGGIIAHNTYISSNLGIGNTAPSAYLHLKAGTTAASTAPIKLTAGDNMTAAEAGAIEFDGTNLYYTDSTPTRQTLATAAQAGANTALSNLASVAVNTSLISDTDSTDDLGSSTKAWANLYTDAIKTTSGTSLDVDTATIDLSTQATAVTLEASAANGLNFDSGTLSIDALNDRVGIGTTTPAMILDVRGAPFLQGSDQATILSFDSSTAAQGVGGGISFGGKYSAAGAEAYVLSNIKGIKENATDSNYAGALVFSTRANGALATEKLRITSDGNVGIGTTAPGALLEVSKGASGGQIATFKAGTSSGGYIIFNNTTSDTLGVGTNLVVGDSTASAVVSYGDSNPLWLAASGASGVIKFLTGSNSSANERMRIDNAGNVGIGTTSPTAYLHLKAGTATASTAPLKLTSGTNLTAAEAGAIEFDGTNLYYTDSTPTRQTLATAAQAGANTALSNLASVAINTSLISDTDSTDDLGSSTINWANVYSDNLKSAAADTALTIEHDGSDQDIYFKVNDGGVDTTVMTLDGATGNVGIGTTAPGVLLHVHSPNASSGDYIAMIVNDRATEGQGHGLLVSAGNGAGDYAFGVSANTGGEKFLVLGNGNVGIGTLGPANKLDVEGGVAVGATYSGTSAAPTNGMIIEGNVGIGTTGPANTLDVNGRLSVTTAGAASALAIGTTTTDAGELVALGYSVITAQGTTGGVFKMSDGANGGQFFYDGTTGLQFSNITGTTPSRLVFQSGDSPGTGNGDLEISTSHNVLINNGNVGIGTTGPGALLHLDKNDAEVRVESHGDSATILPYLRFDKSRGTASSKTIISNNDYLGVFTSRGYDGANYIGAAGIEFYVDGTPGINDMPGRIQFQTTPDGSNTLQTRVTIKNDGNVGIGTTSPNSKLEVTGQYFSTKYALTDGATIAIDWDNANVQSVTLGGNRTITISNPKGGAVYTLLITQDATGSRTLTWPATAKWPGGVTPTLTTTASAVDVFTFVSDGTNCYNIGFAADVK